MLTTEATLSATLDFEAVYHEANGDFAGVPWAHGRPHPALVAWLNAIAPSVVRCGSRIAVVGCGLGDDAIELIRRGYDVTAFDISTTAIEWARRRHPEHAQCFVGALTGEEQASVWRVGIQEQLSKGIVLNVNEFRGQIG